MDLIDFDGGQLYFEEQTDPDVLTLIEQAAEHYGTREGEGLLLKAYFMAPESMMVLVALYRFYFYQHRYDDALSITQRVLSVIGSRLDFPASWRDLSMDFLGWGIMQSFQMVRLYLYALKGAGYMNLRQGNIELAAEMLTKVVELDSRDRIGAQSLLAVANEHRIRQETAQRIVSGV